MAWRKTGVAAATLAPGKLQSVDVDGETLTLANLGTELHALDGFCTHEGGILGQGELRGSRVICPEHQANFDVATGNVLADPDGVEPPAGVIGPVRHFPARIVDGMVEVDLP
jgi:nitrite reductase/ring-hydroxylating ferredoxin subunit